MDMAGPGVCRLPGELELAACDAAATVTCTLRHEGGGLPAGGGRAFVQAALLHSTPDGRRCVRVHNLAMPAAAEAADIFRLADLDVIFAAHLKV